MDKVETENLIILSQEKADKIRSSIKVGNYYNEMNDDIEYIFKYAFDKRKAIWEKCINSIYELAEFSNEIQEKIMKIMETGNARQKFIVTCSLHKSFNLDKGFVKNILHKAIIDKSKNVKIFGAQRADDLSIYEFSDIIKNEMESSNDNDIKEHLMVNYIFLTKGYKIKKINDNRYVNITYYFSVKLPKDIITEEEIHKYVLEKYKDNNRIKDLYYG
jgi:hypothetical protein